MAKTRRGEFGETALTISITDARPFTPPPSSLSQSHESPDTSGDSSDGDLSQEETSMSDDDSSPETNDNGNFGPEPVLKNEDVLQPLEKKLWNAKRSSFESLFKQLNPFIEDLQNLFDTFKDETEQKKQLENLFQRYQIFTRGQLNAFKKLPRAKKTLENVLNLIINLYMEQPDITLQSDIVEIGPFPLSKHGEAPNRRYLGNLLDDAKNWLNKVDPNHIVLNSLLLTLKEHKSNTLINSGEEAFIDFMEKLEENEEFSGAAGEIIYFMSNFKSLLKLPDAEKPLHNIIQYLMGTQKTVDDKYFSVPSDKNFIELIFKHHMNTFQLSAQQLINQDNNSPQRKRNSSAAAEATQEEPTQQSTPERIVPEQQKVITAATKEVAATQAQSSMTSPAVLKHTTIENGQASGPLANNMPMPQSKSPSSVEVNPKAESATNPENKSHAPAETEVSKSNLVPVAKIDPRKTAMFQPKGKASSVNKPITSQDLAADIVRMLEQIVSFTMCLSFWGDQLNKGKCKDRSSWWDTLCAGGIEIIDDKTATVTLVPHRVKSFKKIVDQHKNNPLAILNLLKTDWLDINQKDFEKMRKVKEKAYGFFSGIFDGHDYRSDSTKDFYLVFLEHLKYINPRNPNTDQLTKLRDSLVTWVEKYQAFKDVAGYDTEITSGLAAPRV